MAMHSAANSNNSTAAAARPTRQQSKLRREFSRFLVQAHTLALRPLALTARCRFLFILGHMRSGSTLLCHLLCSSHDILGYGETHTNYRRRSDLAKLLMSVRGQTGENPLKYPYVLDKIVGAQHILSDAVLRDRRTRYIFLVRDPLASIGSIVAMRRQFQQESFEQSLDFAANHYTTRLEQLLRSAETAHHPQRCLLVTHRQLLAETPAVFRALETFLDLRAPLREDYQLMPTTGQPGIGDPSPNIRLGKIDRSLPRKEVAMPAALRARLEACYERSLAELGNRMPSVAGETQVSVRSAA